MTTKLADELTALAEKAQGTVSDTPRKRAFVALGERVAVNLSKIMAALTARSDGWRDIESAPKDGSEILLWPAIRRKVEGKVPCAVGRWSKYPALECWDDLAVGHHNGFWKPTHWQPLPTPPETTP